MRWEEPPAVGGASSCGRKLRLRLLILDVGSSVSYSCSVLHRNHFIIRVVFVLTAPPRAGIILIIIVRGVFLAGGTQEEPAFLHSKPENLRSLHGCSVYIFLIPLCVVNVFLLTAPTLRLPFKRSPQNR